MTRWTVDAPTALAFDDVTKLNVRLIGGTVAVLASEDRQPSPGGTTPRTPRALPDGKASVSGNATLAVSELSGRPLLVCHEDGVLTVSYEALTWDGLLGLLKPRKDSATVTITVPADCPIQLGVLSASAVVAGLHSGAAIKGMSGDVALSTGGSVHVNTMSGDVTLRLPADSDAKVRMHSTSGPVRTEFASLRTVKAPASHTVSGNVGAGTGHVSVTTMSGAVTLLRRAPVGMESKTQ
jgi:hypothetical protein